MVGSHPHHRLKKHHGDIPLHLTLVVHGVRMTMLGIAQMCGQVFHPVLDQGERRASGERTARGLVVVCGEVRLVGLWWWSYFYYFCELWFVVGFYAQLFVVVVFIPGGLLKSVYICDIWFWQLLIFVCPCCQWHTVMWCLHWCPYKLSVSD